jgi:hypothetical protein
LTAQEKISAEIRERLDELGEDESLCALVTLAQPEVSGSRRRKRQRREQILAEVDVYTTNTLDELRSVIEDAGGEILSVSRPLSIITIEGGRALIEKLAGEDSVAAIIENQQIRGLEGR